MKFLLAILSLFTGDATASIRHFDDFSSKKSPLFRDDLLSYTASLCVKSDQRFSNITTNQTKYGLTQKRAYKPVSSLCALKKYK